MNNWRDSIDELAALIDSMRTASSYDEAWERQFPAFAQRGLWELYGRLNPEDRPIINNWVGSAFTTFGLQNPQSYDASAAQFNTLQAQYIETVGHVTATTPHEVPLTEELEQFLYIAETADESELRTAFGMDAPTHDAFAGWDAMITHGDTIELSGLRPILDAFNQAANNDAYESDQPLDHWGANHWETWKDDYRTYLETTVFPEYDPTELTADTVIDFIDALSDSDALGTTKIPTYLLGGRWQPLDDFRTITANNPGDAAAVLSALLDDEQGSITERLRRFNDFYASISDSGSERMSVATMLLMITHPDQYIMYRYSMFSDFFDDFSTYDIPNGFNPSDYILMNDALHSVRADLDTYNDTPVTMLDVHTLLWIYHRQGQP
ncbi:hypothetical protein LPA44_17175 [Halobacterium sp. KA-4]|uniref:hypothetical protein n=1 Tax=Halobacterium sp. KA-4 TaxID=2896367 RepID=UPI001E43D8FF|nr:hypothetical protein [Halobacterium sp. KA-4]MCD2201597.1 hypothetical protein [Halobacterium sp. KA-4]